MTQAHFVYKRDESYACAVAEVAREKNFCKVYLARHFCYGDLEDKVLNHKFKDHLAVRLSFIFTSIIGAMCNLLVLLFNITVIV